MRDSIVWAVCLLCAIVLVSGCSRRPAEVSSGESEETECDELVKNALDMMRPTRLGITSSSEAAVGVLTQWSSVCMPSVTGESPLSPETKMLLKGIDSPGEYDGEHSNFSSRDVEHVRDCLLYKSMVDNAIKKADTDLERSVELFNFVIRNVALNSKNEQTIPLTPYEVILLGRGTPEDRAWIFANLLRQLRIEAVIIRRKSSGTTAESDQTEKSGHWLTAALLNGEAYLFDMKLGLPIPSLKDDGSTVLVQTPATLAEVLENDQVFRRLDIDSEQPYPLKGEDFRNPVVEIIGNRSFWLLRMKELQMSLSGEAVLLFDSLEDTDIGEGIISRVADLGGDLWNRENIVIWSYPEKTLQASRDLDTGQRENHENLFRPFSAPVELQFDPETNRPAIDPKTNRPLYNKPSRTQLSARTDQITGNYDKAISRYQLLRLQLDLDPRIPFPPEYRQTHFRAQEDDFFWTGVCQMEQWEFAGAAETLRKYRSQYGIRGVWVNQSGFLLAVSNAETDKFAVALQILSSDLLEGDWVDPVQRHGYHFLIDRWRTLRDSTQNDTSKSSE